MTAPHITPLPTPPSRSQSPDTFSTDADAFLGALPDFQSDANAQADYLDGLADQVTIDAAAAEAAAAIAAGAANYMGDYNALTTYQIGESVSYNGRRYVAKTVNTGVTPVDGANWFLINDGDVLGPVSATNNGLALFDGTTGKILKSGLANGTAGQALISGGAGEPPYWATPSSNTASFIASGSISAGAPVALKSSGVVEAVAEVTTTDTLGAEATVQTGNPSDTAPRIIYDSVNNRYVAVQTINLSTYAVAGTVSGTTITWGTPVVLNNTGTSGGALVVWDDNVKRPVAFYQYNNTLEARVISGTGLNITLGTAVTLSTNATSGNNFNWWPVYFGARNRVYCAYRAGTSLYVRGLTISGTTITLGSENNIAPTIANYSFDIRMSPAGTDGFSIVAVNSTRTSIYGADLYITDPNGAALGVALNFQGKVLHSSLTSATIGDCIDQSEINLIIYSYKSSTTEYIANWRYGGATPTGTLNVGSNSASAFNISFIKNGSSLRCVRTSGTGVFISDITASATDQVAPTIATYKTVAASGGTQSARALAGLGNIYVYVQNNGSTSNVSRVFAAADISSNYLNYIGLATATVINGQTVNVTTPGGVNTSVTGLTPGTVYYVSPEGTLLSGDYTYPRVGRAITATSILAEDRSVLSARQKTWSTYLNTSATYTVPSGVSSIRIYAFGGGGRAWDATGAGSTFGGGGGGCAFGDLLVVPGDQIVITQTSGNVTIARNSITLMTANCGANASVSGPGTGGTASISSYIKNGAGYPGGSGGTGVGGSSCGGGGSSGSPLGPGYNGGMGGGGWGGNGNFGGGGVGGASSYGGGGAGGAANGTSGGIGRDVTRVFSDPLLATLISPGNSQFYITSTSGNPYFTYLTVAGPGAGGASAYTTGNLNIPGQDGGFGGGGGTGNSYGTGGNGGFGGGGAGGGHYGGGRGTSIAAGGVGAINTASPGLGGSNTSSAVLIYA